MTGSGLKRLRIEVKTLATPVSQRPQPVPDATWPGWEPERPELLETLCHPSCPAYQRQVQRLWASWESGRAF